mgnify:CR=1 FL=1
MSQYYKDMFIEVREEKESDDGILDFVYEMVAKSSAKPLVTEMASDSAREFVLSLPTPWKDSKSPNCLMQLVAAEPLKVSFSFFNVSWIQIAESHRHAGSSPLSLS